MAATDYFASNANIDPGAQGWVTGNDSNNGTARSTPFLTIQAAYTAAVAAGTGSRVIVNPTNTAGLGSPINMYQEGGSSPGYLNMSSTTLAITIQGDSVGIAAGNTAVVTYGAGGSSGSRVVNVATNSALTTLSGLVFNGQSTSGVSGIDPHTQNGGLTITGCTFINFAANTYPINTPGTSAGTVMNVIDCIFASTCAEGMNWGNATFTTLNILGCTFSCSNTALDASNGTFVATTITIGVDGSSNPTIFNGANAKAIVIFGATITTLSITGCQFTGLSLGIEVGGTGRTNAITTMTFNSNTCSGGNLTHSLVQIQNQCTIGSLTVNSNTLNDASGLLLVTTELTTITSVNANTITVTSATGTDPISCTSFVGTSVPFTNNIINAGNSGASQAGHGIGIGPDGPITWDNNTAAASAEVDLNTVTSPNTSVAFSVTPTAATVSTNATFATHLYGITVSLKKAGAPTGVVTCALYSDSSGPNTLIETSTTTVAGTSLTTAYQPFIFQFGTAHTALVPGTLYWYVFSTSGGTPSDTNYFIFATNATTTLGNVSVFTSGSWTADATKEFQFVTLTGPYGTIAPQVIGNKVTGTAGPAYGPHGILVGLTQGAIVQQNQCYNCSPSIAIKDVWAEKSATGDTLISDNLASTNVTNTIIGGGLICKGWPGAGGATRCYQNTFVCSNTEAGGATVSVVPDTFNVGIPVASSAVANPPNPKGVIIENNILYRASGANAGYVYNVTSGSGVVINFNVYYAGNNTTIANLAATAAIWKSLGYDLSSANAFPSLAATAPAAAAGFIPLPPSPALGIGSNLNYFVPTDFVGTSFPDTPTAGAYQVGTVAYLPLNRIQING